MRVGNALLVAGVVTIFAAISGPTMASEDPGRTDPADVVAAEDVVGDGGGAGDTTQPADPAGAGEADRTPDDVETEEVTTDEPQTTGEDGERKGAGGNGGKGKGDEKQPRADVGVEMKNIAFKPKTLHIDPGDEVTWTNRDTAQHDAVGQGSADFDTGLLEKGESASVPFNDDGTFDYMCTVHPTMKGKIVVGDSGGGSGGKGGTTNGGTGGTSSGTGSTSPTGSSGTGSTFPTSSGSSSGGGSLPNTGGVELPLLIFGSCLLVLGLAARAFHEYWTWR
jgi:plastocyanin